MCFVKKYYIILLTVWILKICFYNTFNIIISWSKTCLQSNLMGCLRESYFIIIMTSTFVKATDQLHCLGQKNAGVCGGQCCQRWLSCWWCRLFTDTWQAETIYRRCERIRFNFIGFHTPKHTCTHAHMLKKYAWCNLHRCFWPATYFTIKVYEIKQSSLTKSVSGNLITPTNYLCFGWY